AAFDVAGPVFRQAELKSYKAHRPETESDLASQFPWVREALVAVGIPVLEKFGFEADDIIGTIIEKTKNESGLETVIVTGDLDALQLVSGDRVRVYTLRKGITDTVLYNEKAVKERFGGLGPEQMADYKGLKGDPSDNIPGVPGVGEKTAIALIKEYGNIEGVYRAAEKFKTKNEKRKTAIKNAKLFDRLLEHKDQAVLSKRMATIRRDVPVDFDLSQARFRPAVDGEVKRIFDRLGFKSLLVRWGELADSWNGKIGTKPETSQSVLQDRDYNDDNDKYDELEDYYKKGIFSEKIYKLEKELRPVLRRMEETGFLIDVKALKNLGVKISRELERIKKAVASLAGEEFNLNSTQELGRILFEKLGLGGVRVKKTKTGAYSTAFDQLEKIRNNHPIVPLMLKWREFSKLQSTYIEALPKLVSPKDGRIHTTFKQLGAVTGRLASENPNLQNIPIKSEYGLEIRKTFVARAGFVILSADYSQIELRVAAALSGDEKMVETFKRGEDIHTRTAAEIFNVPLDKVTKDMRQAAKTLNFGVLYGMGPRAFAQSAGVSFDEAKKFIREYENGFAGLAKFIRELKDKARAQGFVETLWGRKRFVDLVSPNPMLRAAAEREAVNMPIQGTATGDIIKAAMVALSKTIGSAADIYMILQVHDELVFEVKKEAIDKYAPVIKKAMENVIKLAVPLVVEMEVGSNWGELEKIT
ncbi:MAG: DNA polymerase, partial [Patescibacteria group bacterium]